jgi:hypothetical protein
VIQIDLTINYKIINKLNKWKLPVIKKNLDTCLTYKIYLSIVAACFTFINFVSTKICFSSHNITILNSVDHLDFTCQINHYDGGSTF